MSDPAQYQEIVDAEWNIIYDKLDKCAASGAKIVLSRLAIGDLATQYFADRDIFCAGRVGSQVEMRNRENQRNKQNRAKREIWASDSQGCAVQAGYR